MVSTFLSLCLVTLPILAHCYCNEGFMDHNLLRKKAAQIPSEGALSDQKMSRVNATRWLFPDLRFSCESGVITEATIGIDVRGFDRSYPAIELWKKLDNDQHQYTKVPCGYTIRLTSSNSTTDSVFTIKFPIPLSVTSLHALGLYQPGDADSTVRFFYDDNTTSTAYRIVNHEDTEVNINDNSSAIAVPRIRLFIHAITEPASCSEGFIELDVLKSKVHEFTNVVPLFGQQRVFPNISFTCEGYVTKWIIGGINESGINYPRIRIAREDELSLKEAITLNPIEAVETDQNIYEFNHRPPLHVRGGDLLVMLHSGNSDVNKMVYYQAVSGPDNYLLSDLAIRKLEENIYPLISVVVESQIPYETSIETEIRPTVTESALFSSVDSTNVDSTNVDSTNVMNKSNTFEQYIIAVMGTIIGTLGLMLLVTVTLVIFLVLHIRRKREFAINPTRKTTYANSIVLIDFTEDESKINDKRINILNGSFRGRRLIIKKASENVIENLDECDNEIHIKARISLSDGDSSDDESDLQVDNEPFQDPANDADILWTQLSQMQIKRQEIQVIEQFKYGQFGEIAEAVWKSSSEGTSIVTINKVQNDADRIKLLKAAATVVQFNHRSIIKLHGIVVDEEPTIIVFEQLIQSLSEYLEKRKSLDKPAADRKLMMSFSSQIACGMEYLHRKSYIHGNLTSSNIQLSKSNNCKINGFFEDVVENSVNMSSQQSSAPEVAKSHVRTKEGDVWSYGMIMEEIWKLEMSGKEDARSTDEYNQGCDDCFIHQTAIHELILQCREVEASRRPDFIFLNAHLLQFL